MMTNDTSKLRQLVGYWFFCLSQLDNSHQHAILSLYLERYLRGIGLGSDISPLWKR
jgi:hypothetical protein